jgi:hypothetical protein
MVVKGYRRRRDLKLRRIMKIDGGVRNGAEF